MEEKKEATSTVVVKEQFVNARELHTVLEAKTKFNEWITRKIEEYSFDENTDYFVNDYTPQFGKKFPNCLSLSSIVNDDFAPEIRVVETELSASVKSKDYILTLDMAKELAMVEKNEVGKKVRKYFIEIEKRFRLIESKYRNFVEEKQTQLEELHGKRKSAKTNFNEARHLLNDIENEIHEVLKMRFHDWQDLQRVQALPFPKE